MVFATLLRVCPVIPPANKMKAMWAGKCACAFHSCNHHPVSGTEHSGYYSFLCNTVFGLLLFFGSLFVRCSCFSVSLPNCVVFACVTREGTKDAEIKEHTNNMCVLIWLLLLFLLLCWLVSLLWRCDVGLTTWPRADDIWPRDDNMTEGWRHMTEGWQHITEG